MPKGIPLTDEEQYQRRWAIFNTAVGLFLEKGFVETSMREIAAAAGMGKSSLYDYFQTKDQILMFFMKEKVVSLIEQARAIAALDLPLEDRIRRIMELQINFWQANDNLFTRLLTELQRLNARSQADMQKMRYAYQDLLRSLIEEGVTQGVFREVDPLLAARLMINSMLSVAFTSRPTGSIGEMLNETVDIILHGIQK